MRATILLILVLGASCGARAGAGGDSEEDRKSRTLRRELSTFSTKPPSCSRCVVEAFGTSISASSLTPRLFFLLSTIIQLVMQA
jgi:hypothetical protein